MACEPPAARNPIIGLSHIRHFERAKAPASTVLSCDFHGIYTFQGPLAQPVHSTALRTRLVQKNESNAHAESLDAGKADFETEVLLSKQPVTVVFRAPWSGASGALNGFQDFK
jgi:hypothetical protein